MDLEENKRNAIRMAAEIHKVVSNPLIIQNTDVESRYNMCLEKYKGFAQSFPVILAKMVIENRYNETAFIRYLDRVQKNPGKGLEGLMSGQADYAKFLYIEECKAAGKKWSGKYAKQIWEHEYNELNQRAKDIKKQEEQARNEYEENEKKYLAERKTELLNYLSTIDSTEYQEDAKALLDNFQLEVSDEQEAPEYSNLTINQAPTEVTQEVYESVQPRLERPEYTDNPWLNHLTSTGNKKSKTSKR